MYPIAKLVIDIISENDDAKQVLMKEFGIKNINASNTVIQDLIHGEFDQETLNRLVKVLPAEGKLLVDAANDTFHKIREEEEAQLPEFRPHLWTLHEQSRPSMSIVIMGLTGVEHFRLVKLPEDIAELPLGQQIEIIKEMISEKHQVEHKMVFRYNSIMYGTFGKITNYVYAHHRGKFILLDAEGNILEMNYQYVYTNTYVKIKNKTFRFNIKE